MGFFLILIEILFKLVLKRNQKRHPKMVTLLKGNELSHNIFAFLGNGILDVEIAIASLFGTSFILDMHCNHGKKLYPTLLFMSILWFFFAFSDVNYTSRVCIHKWDIKLQHNYNGMYLSIFSSLLL